MPFFILGSDFSTSLWQNSWYFSLIFILLLGGLNFYFISHWKFYSFLEGEKWVELTSLLEEEIYLKSKGRRGIFLNRQKLQIFINGCMITSQLEKLVKLDEFLQEKQPKLRGAFALSLGLPHLLKEDTAAMEDYYKAFSENTSVDSFLWCRWFYGFALLLQKKIEPAIDSLESIIPSKEPILEMLTLYLLDTAGVNFDSREDLKKVKDDLKLKLAPHKYQQEKDKRTEPVLILVLSDFLNKAHHWLFGDAK